MGSHVIIRAETPQEALISLLTEIERADIETAVDLLIERLDKIDGDFDLEEDDPAGGDIVDQPHDAEEDFGAEESGEATLGVPEDQSGRWGGNLVCGDMDDRNEDEEDGFAIRRRHRDRIRRSRCDRLPHNRFRLRGAA